MPVTGRYRDEDVTDPESVPSSPTSPVERVAPSPAPRWYRRGRARARDQNVKADDVRVRSLGSSSLARRRRRRTRIRVALISLVILMFFGSIAGLSYISLVSALIRRLSPPKIDNGLQDIVENWQEPDANGPYQFEWPDDFSRDIVPKTCHSHNDYWRTVPLYEALAAGCVGVEADIWLMDDGELRVSHTWSSIKEARTLRNMYLDPLENIFTNRNVSLASTKEKEVGVFDADPNMSVNLLIDFKNDGHEIWPVVVEQLRPLYEKRWLTYFDGNEIVRGPLTIIGTGNTPFELVQEMQNRFIFFDAPLDDIANPAYTAENSYYASVKMYKAIGIMWFNKLSAAQIDTLKEQIKAASDKGLVSRYWGTPSWPISLRNKVWFTLSELGVGMLNVDDLVSATRWDWNWCVVAGLNLCGNR